MPPATDMTPPQVADVLGCTPPTVRTLIGDGVLRAVATKKGSRTFYTISRADVDAYVQAHGKFTRRAHRHTVGTDTHELLVEEIRSLRKLVVSRPADSSGAEAEAVALRESLQLQRAAMSTLLEADDDRSEGVRLMLQAMGSFESADAKRKRAISLLDEVLGSLTLPRSAADLTDD